MKIVLYIYLFGVDRQPDIYVEVDKTDHLPDLLASLEREVAAWCDRARVCRSSVTWSYDYE